MDTSRPSPVPLHVEGEVVGTTEGARTELAMKRSVAAVLAAVTRQLVGASKAPHAARVHAGVRLLP